jgi:hypothetical protein
MYGYTWTLSKNATYNAYGGDFDFKSSDFWGIAVDMAVEYWHVGFRDPESSTYRGDIPFIPRMVAPASGYI